MGKKDDKPTDISKLHQDDDAIDKIARGEKLKGDDEADDTLKSMLGVWVDDVNKPIEDAD